MDEARHAEPPLPPGRELTLPGRGTTFVREIEGPAGAPTVFLLHGLGVSADLNWFRCYEALGRRFRVVAIDHRGHGRGIRSSRPFRLTACADDVVAVADELGLEQIVPVGYSMGGPIAQFTWKRHPDRVAGLVLCATSRSFARQGARERALMSSLLALSAAARITPRQLRGQLMASMLRGRMDGTPLGRWARHELQRGDQAAILQATWSVASFDSRPWIDRVDVPTAVVVTERDQLVPAWRQRKLAEAIPGATVHPVQADHGACVLAARLFVPVLLDACSAVTSRQQSSARS
jgi:pimeloyl-ACP methyl ester carboxylesterase